MVIYQFKRRTTPRRTTGNHYNAFPRNYGNSRIIKYIRLDSHFCLIEVMRYFKLSHPDSNTKPLTITSLVHSSLQHLLLTSLNPSRYRTVQRLLCFGHHEGTGFSSRYDRKHKSSSQITSVVVCLEQVRYPSALYLTRRANGRTNICPDLNPYMKRDLVRF